MHALVVMPDHVHLIFTPLSDRLGNPYGLAEILGGIKGASAHTINKRVSRKGPVWQDESFDHILRREEKLEQKIEYIRQNPVRKGIVSEPQQYPYTWVEGRGLADDKVNVAQPPSAVQGLEQSLEHKSAQPGAAVPHVLPAAGTFDGWPKSLKEFTMLDPCCGSGHFLVAGFRLLVPLRIHDEGLSAAEACDAVLHENLFGLELDPRCTQIAAFALAMAAWTYLGPDGQLLGYRALPPLNIACSGQGVLGSKEDWTKIANNDKNFVAAMGFLYDEFRRAPTLGSLINPRSVAESVFFTGFAAIHGTLERTLKRAESPNRPGP
jgi:hypothetical protein